MDIYSIVMISPDKGKFVMWLTAAEDIEHAVRGAFDEIKRKFPDDEPTKWNVAMFQKKTDGELRAEFDPEYMKKVMAWGESFEAMKHVVSNEVALKEEIVVSSDSYESKPSEKSRAMKKIIHSMSFDLLEERKNEFEVYEVEYMAAEITKKQKRKIRNK